MARKKLRPQTEQDRRLCPVRVAEIMRLKVHQVARRMRAAGVTDTLTPAKAKAWRANPERAPEWLTELLAERAARLPSGSTVSARSSSSTSTAWSFFSRRSNSGYSPGHSVSVTRTPS
jgi:hypothetical protein